ncbi:hypothetical protein [Aestuariispira insulae]|uniref:Response regulatory domain-containing protein n=1 Tax=Aestuariispira insulae TaxID=1461337 RepID=A0A3D9H7E9_9PROT|nr:hypothetical protein [Aestuariispira insulae]RED45081.1 hypothetical protein DFP90_11274 [Aestuariispira insulae]
MELRAALHRQGYGQIRDMRNLDQVYDVVSGDNMPDILILDSSLTWESRTVPKLIRDIRHGKLGRNPFVPIIATIWTPDQRQVTDLINSGPDVVLVKPFSTQSLIDRIDAVAFDRKEFVVTSDYLGPDRRKKERNNANSAELFKVPNMLENKLIGAVVDAVSFAREIAEVQTQVKNRRQKANAFQMAFLVALSRDPLVEGNVDKFLIRNLERIRDISVEMTVMLKEAGHGELSETCGKLRGDVTDILDNIKDIAEETASALERDTNQVLMALHPDETPQQVAERVVKSVGAFKNYTGQEDLHRPVTQFGS